MLTRLRLRIRSGSGCLLAFCLLIGWNTRIHAGPAGTDAAANAEAPAAPLPPAAEHKIDFVQHIRPLLAEHCWGCHGTKEQESGLRLDRKSAALAGGDSGAVIVPGKGAESLLVHLVAGLDEDRVMPPEGERLTNEQVGLFRAWIDQGAVWPKEADVAATQEPSDHWAYQPIRRPDEPAPKRSDWIRNPIDAFILARLEEAGIEPSPEADRSTLVRRLHLDLLGLPPTPEQVDAFVNDASPDAYERLVDRLLRSPHFGERWGRHWLDMARYADSDGYEKDNPRPDAWRWRNWVIEAINADMPFDQFTIEQVAGDLLPNPTEAQKLATAFHRQTLTNTEGGTDKEQFRVEAVFDRVETIGTVWLGLTVGCARCHTHKYDRITQREYYQLFAFLNNGDEVSVDVRISDEAVAKYEQEKARHDQAVAASAAKLTSHKAELAKSLPAWEAEIQAKLAAIGENEIRFHPLEVVSLESQGSVTWKKLDDGSYLAGGANPEKDRYALVAKVDPANLSGVANGITGFRLETLADKSLPARGPGRVAHGNFVLNEFRVSVGAAADAQETTPVELHNATADYSQGGWDVKGAIDGDLATGWAIAQEFNKDHAAVFRTKSPLEVGGSQFLHFVLDQQYGKQHTIGRLRITVMTGTETGLGLPENVRQVLAVAPEQRDAKQQAVLLDHFAAADAAYAKLATDLEDLKKKPPKSPYMSVRVVAERTSSPRTTHMLRRGDFLQPMAEIQPGTLGVLPPCLPRSEESAGDRLDLAHWLVSPENPLTPRVAVNHIWRYLFGNGLVRSVNDFGVRGDKPTHPELLDWLATEYLRLGWNRKAMIKRMVMSAAYRQSSAHRPELIEVDPQNNLLARQNRFRVEAELVRDLSLAAGGLLSAKIGGPSVFPPMPADVAALSYANNFKWNTSPGEDRVRRAMYTFFKRTAPHPNLVAFDCPDSNTTCVERRTSNTPLQALTTLNNETFVEAAQSMARRLLERNFESDSDRLGYAFRACVARHPSSVELARFTDLLETCRAWYNQEREDAKQIVGNYQPPNVSPQEAAAWMATARVLLNMDGFLTRE